MNTVRNTKRQTDTCIYDQTVHATVRWKNSNTQTKKKGKEERNKEQKKERKMNKKDDKQDRQRKRIERNKKGKEDGVK